MVWVSKALIGTLCVLAVSTTLAAESVPLTVQANVPSTSKPQRAYVVVSRLGEVIAVAPAHSIESSTTGGVDLVGQVLLAEAPAEFTAGFLVVGEAGEVSSTSADLSLEGRDSAALLSRNALRLTLQERAIELRRREGQVREQEQSLKRIQSDTDKIAQVDRMVDAEDKLDSLRADTKRLSEALDVINTRLETLKGRTATGLVRRQEAELSAELNALSVALKSTEADALKRVSDASQELKTKLNLIENTKNEHVDLLQNELQSLMKERKALESKAR